MPGLRCSNSSTAFLVIVARPSLPHQANEMVTSPPPGSVPHEASRGATTRAAIAARRLSFPALMPAPSTTCILSENSHRAANRKRALHQLSTLDTQADRDTA